MNSLHTMNSLPYCVDVIDCLFSSAVYQYIKHVLQTFQKLLHVQM